MSVSILIGSRPVSAVSFGESPLAELGTFLHAMRGRDPHPRFPAELSETIDALNPELGYGLVRFSPLWSSYHSRMFYPRQRLPEQSLSVAESLAVLHDIPHELFVTYLIWSCLDGYRAPRVTPDQRSGSEMADFATAAHKLSPVRGALADAIVADPVAVRTEVISVIEEFATEVFAAQWDRLAPDLRRDAQARQQALSTPEPRPFHDLPGFELKDEPWRLTIKKSMSRLIRLDERQLICVPTYFGLPHVRVKDEPGHPVVIHYPVAPGAQTDAPAAQSRLRVIGTPQRLELCRLLARESLSTSELAARLRMGVPQTARHLRSLRTAGLIRSERRGKYVYYELDLGAVARSGADFARALLT